MSSFTDPPNGLLDIQCLRDYPLHRQSVDYPSRPACGPVSALGNAETKLMHELYSTVTSYLGIGIYVVFFWVYYHC